MEPQKYLNPWKSIWSKPKETIRQIIDVNPNHRMGLLMLLYGLLGLISLSQQYSLGIYYNLWIILAAALILAPLWGYIAISLSSFVIFFSGKLLNGQGNYKEVRAVFTWAVVPLVVNLVTWIFLIGLFGLGVFVEFPAGMTFSAFNIYLVLILFTAQVVFSVWSFVIVINGISEVQKFSILRSIGNLLLGALVFAVISLLIFTAIHWTCSPFFHEPVMVSI